MPHYKCDACRARMQVSGQSPELVGYLCPECGSLLEPVVELADLVGFRAIRSLDGQADPVRSTSHRRIADSVDGFIANRAATLGRDQLDAESWLDDTDPPVLAAAIALPPPRP